jgi:hypothetical protein
LQQRFSWKKLWVKGGKRAKESQEGGRQYGVAAIRQKRRALVQTREDKKREKRA